MPASKRQHGTTKSVRPGSMSNSWFEVDKAGLAKIVAARGKVFVLYELLQNAFDEDGVTEIAVRFEPIPGRPEVLLEIIDDSHNGFHRLSDAWTMTRTGSRTCGTLIRCSPRAGRKGTPSSGAASTWARSWSCRCARRRTSFPPPDRCISPATGAEKGGKSERRGRFSRHA